MASSGLVIVGRTARELAGASQPIEGHEAASDQNVSGLGKVLKRTPRGSVATLQKRRIPDGQDSERVSPRCPERGWRVQPDTAQAKTTMAQSKLRNQARTLFFLTMRRSSATGISKSMTFFSMTSLAPKSAAGLAPTMQQICARE